MNRFKKKMMKKFTDKEKQIKKKINNLIRRFLAAIMFYVNKLKKMFRDFAISMGKEIGKLMGGLANKVNQEIGNATKNILKF